MHFDNQNDVEMKRLNSVRASCLCSSLHWLLADVGQVSSLSKAPLNRLPGSHHPQRCSRTLEMRDVVSEHGGLGLDMGILVAFSNRSNSMNSFGSSPRSHCHQK